MQQTIDPLQRNWAMAAHLSALAALVGVPFGHVIGPLVVQLIEGAKSEFVAQHAKASLNYQITLSIFALIGVVAVIFGNIVMFGFIAAGGHHSGSEETRPLGFGVFWVAVAATVVVVMLGSLAFIVAGTIAANEGRPYRYPFAISFLR